MPRLLRHKVLTLPLPNLLPILPPDFVEAAKSKRRAQHANGSNGTDRKSKAKGKGKGTVNDSAENIDGEEGEDIAVASGSRSGSGMDVDEIGSTVASTDLNGSGSGSHVKEEEGEASSRLPTDPLEEDVPMSELPEPTEEEIRAFFSRSNGHVNGTASGSASSHTGETVISDYQSQAKALAEMQAAQKENNKDWKEPEVFLIEETGEIFLDYESYVNRILFYKQKIFNSENNVHSTADMVTTFFGALDGEKSNSAAAQGGLPPVLKRACLQFAQFSLEGRLETLQDKTYARLLSRFFPQEKVFVDLNGDHYIANIAEVVCPSRAPSSSKGKKAATALQEPHALAMDSTVTQEDADSMDDWTQYRYKVQLISPSDMERNKPKFIKEDSRDLWGNQVVEVDAEAISRDKNEFSKLAIKRLFRDSLTRESILCAPWVVNAPLAKRYGIPMEIPEAVAKISEAERKSQIEKRRRTLTKEPPVAEVVEEGPPSKKQKVEGAPSKKRVTAAQKAEAAAIKAEEERVKREQEEEAARIEAEKKKKKAMKYPAEDYLVEYSGKESSAGKPQVRPSFSTDLPFPMHFETLITTWNFLNAMSKPLSLSTFTIDEYEHALYHNNPLQHCTLIQEIHQSLLSVIRTDALTNQDLVLPLKAAVPPDGDGSGGGETSDESDDEDEDKQEKIKLATNQAGIWAENFAAQEVGGGKASKRDWEGMLAGCLWQRGTTHSVPNLIHYLIGLLLEAENVPTGRPTWSAASTRPKLAKNLSTRYLALHPIFKLEIVAFLCELAMQTGLIRDYYDQAALALSKCRNDQNATKRELAKLRGENEKPEEEVDANGDAHVNGDGEDAPSVQAPASEDSSLSDSGESSSAGVSRQEKVKAARIKKEALVRQAQMEALEANKKKKADDKARRMEKEEEQRLLARITELAREFRRQFNSMRTYPIGQDRFLHTIWWLDGCGTADLVGSDGDTVYGTGRLYVQGPSEVEVQRVIEEEGLDEAEMEEKRKAEEPQGERLEPGEWAAIDTPERLEEYINWLNDKGKRDGKLLKALGALRPFIEAGMRKRNELYAPEPEVEEQGLTARRQKRNTNKNPYHSVDSYLGYKNTYR